MRYLIAEHSLSVQRSCKCLGLSRAAYYKETIDWAERDAEVVDKLNEVIEKKLELTRFRGHLTLFGGGVHDAEIKTTVPARVS